MPLQAGRASASGDSERQKLKAQENDGETARQNANVAHGSTVGNPRRHHSVCACIATGTARRRTAYAIRGAAKSGADTSAVPPRNRG